MSATQRIGLANQSASVIDAPFRPPSRRSIDHHAPDAFTGVHQVEALVDVFQLQRMGDHRIDLDLAAHVPVDDLRHVGTAASAAKGRALPDAAGDELEGARCDLLTGFGY